MNIDKIKNYVEKTSLEMLNKAKELKKEHEPEIEKIIEKGKDLKNKTHKKFKEFQEKYKLD